MVGSTRTGTWFHPHWNSVPPVLEPGSTRTGTCHTRTVKMPCPTISKESLDNPERHQHFPSPKPILIGEAVQAVEYRIAILLPVQQVVEVYPYAEFPEGVVEAGIE